MPAVQSDGQRERGYCSIMPAVQSDGRGEGVPQQYPAISPPLLPSPSTSLASVFPPFDRTSLSCHKAGTGVVIRYGGFRRARKGLLREDSTICRYHAQGDVVI